MKVFNTKNSKKTIIVSIISGILLIGVIIVLIIVQGKAFRSPKKYTDLLASGFEKMPEVGDIIEFGSYEQDNDQSNGIEPIEWIVLSVDKQNGEALLLSKYALDSKKYNEEYTDITWEKCSLRGFLNNEFYNTAFSSNERKNIVSKNIENEDNPTYGTDGGNNTYDNVFLLSLSDIVNTNYGFNSSFSVSDVARCCVPTAYAIAQSKYDSDSNTCWWWLRSPGNDAYSAAGVYYDGHIGYYGGNVVSVGRLAVRPALYINLKS